MDATPTSPPPPAKAGLLLVIGLAIYALAWTQLGWVKATNFESADEWLVLSLASRGIVDVPVGNRPLGLLWNRIPALVAPHDLDAIFALYVSYLGISGALLAVIANRLLPAAPIWSFLAGSFVVLWAPTDSLRLTALYSTPYAGVTLSTLLAVLLLVEAWLRRSPLLLAVGLVVATITALVYEGALPLLLAAPLLLLALRRRRPPWASAYVAAWLVTVALLAARVVLPLLSGAGVTGYARLLQPDPDPLHVAVRLWTQLGFHLGPLLSPRLAELRAWPVAVVVSAFVLALALVVRWAGGPMARPASAAALWWSLGGGLAAAALGYGGLLLAAQVKPPLRAQFLSAPGIGILLASAILLVVRRLPARAGGVVAALLGAWVVAVGTARVLAMQERFDRVAAFEGQRSFLTSLAALAPDLRPHTLVILLDDSGAWSTNFSFRYAIDYLYEGHAVGYGWRLWSGYFPTRFVAAGLLCEPVPGVRGPWRSPIDLHRYDETMVVHFSRTRQLSVLTRWPAGLFPELPPGASYDPLARILPRGVPPASRAILGGSD